MLSYQHTTHSSIGIDEEKSSVTITKLPPTMMQTLLRRRLLTRVAVVVAVGLLLVATVVVLQGGPDDHSGSMNAVQGLVTLSTDEVSPCLVPPAGETFTGICFDKTSKQEPFDSSNTVAPVRFCTCASLFCPKGSCLKPEGDFDYSNAKPVGHKGSGAFETCWQAGDARSLYRDSNFNACQHGGKNWKQLDAQYVNPSTTPFSCGPPVQAFVIPNTKRNERRRYKNKSIHVMVYVNGLVNNLLPI